MIMPLFNDIWLYLSVFFWVVNLMTHFLLSMSLLFWIQENKKNSNGFRIWRRASCGSVNTCDDDKRNGLGSPCQGREKKHHKSGSFWASFAILFLIQLDWWLYFNVCECMCLCFSPFRRDDPLWCCRCRVEMHEDLDWITDFARLNHIISIFSDVFSCFFPTRFQPWAHLKRALAITGFCWGRDFEKLWIWRIKFRYVFTVFCIQRSDVKEKCQRELIALEGEHGN